MLLAEALIPKKTLSALNDRASIGRPCGADEIDWKFSCMKLTISTLVKHLGRGFKPKECEFTLASFYYGERDDGLRLHYASKIVVMIETKTNALQFLPTKELPK